MEIIEREKEFGIKFLIKSTANMNENVSLCVDTGTVFQ